MAEMRENSQVDEDFHEETPQEFASQPDREFSKLRPEGASDEKESDSPSGSQERDDSQKKVSDGQ